jgi:hypothetical protein
MSNFLRTDGVRNESCTEYTTQSSPKIQGVHFGGVLDVQNLLSADIFISRQTDGYSFGDHLISESVSIMPSSVIEASTVLCSVSL